MEVVEVGGQNQGSLNIVNTSSSLPSLPTPSPNHNLHGLKTNGMILNDEVNSDADSNSKSQSKLLGNMNIPSLSPTKTSTYISELCQTNLDDDVSVCENAGPNSNPTKTIAVSSPSSVVADFLARSKTILKPNSSYNQASNLTETPVRIRNSSGLDSSIASVNPAQRGGDIFKTSPTTLPALSWTPPQLDFDLEPHSSNMILRAS